MVILVITIVDTRNRLSTESCSPRVFGLVFQQELPRNRGDQDGLRFGCAYKRIGRYGTQTGQCYYRHGSAQRYGRER